MENRMFALDIGTRSVTGIILEIINGKYHIVDFVTKEHAERSMLDGQIHNVLEVASVIQQIRETLERKYGPLEKVSVAAAGRSLYTSRASASITLDQQPITKHETVQHLELSAVQSAQFKLAQQQEETSYENYYCVGYSVLHYTLDDEVIGSLVDQRGLEASVEVIATFLPKVVVESLLATLKRAGLTMEALTLEPIAAIQVLIPSSMRRLNVALVDIGAGTSDIAVTRDGTISAYGMVPLAGDSITEAISDHYLLDFNEAEMFKRNIVNNKEATVADILGFEQTVSEEQLVEQIFSALENLAHELTEKILTINSEPPQAIMLIGGGSKTPHIGQMIARKLKLPENRVAVRDITAIQNVTTGDLPTSPEYVTPIGIAITAKNNPVNYLTVTVNERPIRMFEMKQLTVGDCLIQAGIDLKKYYGKPGLARFVTVNGEKITLPGELGESPTLLLNGEATTIDEAIDHGDELTVEKGMDGSQPKISIQELIGEKENLIIYFNDEHQVIPINYYVNDKLKDPSYIVQDRDRITYTHTLTIEQFLRHLNISLNDSLLNFYVYVNGERQTIEKGNTQILRNEKQVHLHETLSTGDHLILKNREDVFVKDLLTLLDESLWHMIEVSFNGEKVLLKQERLIINRKKEKLEPEHQLYQGDELTIDYKKQTPFIFQDVFRFVKVERPADSSAYQLYKNDEVCSFDEPIHYGDRLEIKWDF